MHGILQMFGILGLQNLWHPLANPVDISIINLVTVQAIFIEISQIFNKYLGEDVFVHRENLVDFHGPFDGIIDKNRRPSIHSLNPNIRKNSLQWPS
jgi:hypothetical protein